MENNKSNAFNDFIKPILVLVIICFVVTFALALTYGKTKPIIDENTLKAANEARNQLLPAAESQFEEAAHEDVITLSDGKEVVIKDVYTATNGAGEVITVASQSYGGTMTVMVGIDKEGAITSVMVTEHADTPGVGTKAQTEEHLGQYTGLTELTSTDIKKDTDVQCVTGASVSSGAVHRAVCAAVEQHKLLGGADNGKQ